MSTIGIHAVRFGFVLSAILFGLLLGVLRWNPEIMLNDYPPDIKVRWGPMTPRTKRQRAVVAAIFLAVIIAVVAWSVETLPTAVSHQMTFASMFGHFAIMFGIFNLLDFCVLDCALVYWQPRFAVLPGTEGMAGYRSYRFHFHGFLIGIPATATAAAVCPAAVMWWM